MPAATPRSSTASPGRGQALVLAMLLAGVLAATFAWWWNFNRGRQSLDFFGAEAATLVRTAPRVEYLRPKPEANLDISQAPGLINARASLLSDASYDWQQPDPSLESPLFTVRFTRDDRSVEIKFDFENRTIKTSSTGRTAALTKKTADGWQTYLARQTKSATPLPSN